MKRRHLFEFTDLPGCPAIVRSLVTDYLESILRLLRLFEPMTPLVARLLTSSRSERIVDLCSGASGPVVHIQRNLRESHGLRVPIMLSDKFPDLEAFRRTRARSGGELDAIETPVDAAAVPAGLVGARTLFNSLHHFQPHQVKAVLADAVQKRAAIGAFEVTERSFRSILGSLLLPFLILLITPLIRPFTLWRLLLTYVLPVAPLIICWDALVSSLRSYSADKLLDLARSASEGRAYVWEAGQVHHLGFLPVTYLMGWPAEQDQASSSRVC